MLLSIFALFFSFFACTFEIYLLCNLIRSKGKFPPFISSFGQSKADTLYLATQIIKQLPPNSLIADLGCGSAQLLLPLAKAFPQHRFHGFEWDIFPFWLAKSKIHRHHLSNITLFKTNFMNVDFSPYQLLLCYTGNGLQEELGLKLAQEISPDCFVISEIFSFNHLHLTEQHSTTLFGVSTQIFVYRQSSKK